MRIPLTFIQWTQLGFKDTEARVILNGHLSDPFPLTGGVGKVIIYFPYYSP